VRAELATLRLRGLSRRRLRHAARALAGPFADHDLLTYSSAIAFQALYAVVPLLLVVLAGLGLFGLESTYTHHIAPTLRRDLSTDAYRIANRTALRVIEKKQFFWCSLGLVATAWGAGSCLRSMMRPLNAVYGTSEDRSWGRRIAISVGGGLVVMVCVLLAAAVVLGGRLAHPTGVLAVGLFLLRWLDALALLLIAIATLIRLVPAKKRPFAWVTVGSIVSAICWTVATLGFAAYVSAVSYSSFYGALAGLILLLIYLHVSAIAFLLGVVVDAQLRQAVNSSSPRRGRSRRSSSRQR
jgi:membrane protein